MPVAPETLTSGEPKYPTGSAGAPQGSYLYLLARIAPQWWQTRVSELTLPAQ